MSVYHHHQSWQNGHVSLFSFSNAGDDDAGAANLKSFVATVQSEHNGKSFCIPNSTFAVPAFMLLSNMKSHSGNTKNEIVKFYFKVLMAASKIKQYNK